MSKPDVSNRRTIQNFPRSVRRMRAGRAAAARRDRRGKPGGDGNIRLPPAPARPAFRPQ
ncbi:hypothetical protein ACV229_19180 [Burkholderia sp. MR1-5-21]